MKKLLLLFLFSCVGYSVFANASVIQKGWRWHKDDGSETEATWAASSNTGITLNSATDNLRLRMEFLVGYDPSTTNSASKYVDYQISYATDPAGPFTKISTTDTDGRDPHFVLSTSGFVTTSTATTQQINSGLGAPFAPGRIIDVNETNPYITFSTPSGENRVTEYEWVIKPTSYIQPTTYYFKLEGLNGYSTSLPSLTYSPGPVNNTPTTVGTIAALSVLENAANDTVSLEDYFSDTEDGADGLTYSIQSTDSSYFSTSIDTGNLLIVDYAATGKGGPASVKVRATDSGGKYAEQSFNVTVKASEVSFAITGKESFNEGNTGTATKTFTITKTGTTNFTSQVKFAFSGSAANPADFKNIGGTSGANSTSGTVTFSASETSKTITIDVLGNALYEDNKTITVSLSAASASGSGSASLGTASATKTILNDDAKPTVSLSLGKSTIGENGTAIKATATLDTISGKDVTVNLSYAGTATGGGTDYTASSSSISIKAGQLSGDVTITLADDAVYEGDETVSIDISSVTDGIKQGTAQVLTIIEDDQAPTVILSTSAGSVVEDGGKSIVTATLSAASAKATTIDLLIGGTATETTDYNITAKTITISAGSTSGTVTLAAVDDATGEANETIVVEIDTVTNGTEDEEQKVEVSILDDDKLPQTISFTAIGTKTYGDADLTLSATASSGLAVYFRSGDPAIASINGNVLSFHKAGEVTIKAIQDGDATYQSAVESQTITISKAVLTVTSQDTSKIYGEENPVFKLTFNGFIEGDDKNDLTKIPTVTTTATQISDVGTYKTIAENGEDENYTFNYVKGNLEIHKKALTVTAEDKSRAYSDVDPEFTIVYSGFITGQDKSVLDELPVASTFANATSPVGDYDITVNGGSDNNYTYDYTSGTLTIFNNAPTVAIAVENQVATEEEAFSFSFKESNFEDVDAGDELVYSISLEDEQPLPAWLTFDAFELSISGTPKNSDVGSRKIAIIATDKAGATGTAVFTLTVTNVNDAPVVATAIPDQLVYKGQAFVFVISENSFYDEDMEDQLTYEAKLSNGNTLPAWLSFEATTQTFSGVPSTEDLGSLSIVVTATDKTEASVSDEFMLEVINGNSAPTNISLSATEVEENKSAGTLIGQFTTADADENDVHVYSLVPGDGSSDNDFFYIEGDKVFANASFDAEVKDTYSIRVASSDTEGEKIEKVFAITIKNIEDARAFIPNLFSPNGDESNDMFRVRANGVKQISLKIFNRWGEMVFETSDIRVATESGWDGSFNGKEQPSGTYVWQISGKYTDGTPMKVNGRNTGNITLIR